MAEMTKTMMLTTRKMNAMTATSGPKARISKHSTKVPVQAKAVRSGAWLLKTLLLLGLFGVAGAVGPKYVGTRGANLQPSSTEIVVPSEFVLTDETLTNKPSV